MLPNECSPFSSKDIDSSGLEDISIYVGGNCNFNCSYCDRDFIKTTGLQKLDFDPDIITFISGIFEDRISQNKKLPLISFHGGETLLFLNTIEIILKTLIDKFSGEDIVFYIQTNGSLILKNKLFFENYRENLYVSISYDFCYQVENRRDFDIHETLSFLDSLNIKKQLQAVIPTLHKNPFDIKFYTSIIEIYKKHQIHSLNLILLRHTRKVDEFTTVIADSKFDTKKIFSGFIQLIQLLYVSGINVAIDGHSSSFDKSYYFNHRQIVLAPDGLIYPEYQFIEYKFKDFSLGQWKQPSSIQRQKMNPQAEKKMQKICRECPQNEYCGLQYYYAMFSQTPPAPNKCQEFYSFMHLTLMHLFKLKKHQNLLEAIGV